ETHMINRPAFRRGLRLVDLVERDFRTRNVGRLELSALARRRTEVLDVPLLSSDWIGHPQMNVMHPHRSRERLVFVDLDADAVGAVQVTLPWVVSSVPVQSRCFPPRNALIKIFDVKARAVDYGSNCVTVIV